MTHENLPVQRDIDNTAKEQSHNDATVTADKFRNEIAKGGSSKIADDHLRRNSGSGDSLTQFPRIDIVHENKDAYIRLERKYDLKPLKEDEQIGPQREPSDSWAMLK